MNLPHTYTARNDTGCCAVPNIQDWDEKKMKFENKPFIRKYTRSFMYIPMNMSTIMTKIQILARGADADMDPQDAMTLSRDITPWKAEHLYAVSKPVQGADNVVLDGTVFTKVFEGPYQNIRKWYTTLADFVQKQGSKADKTYFFYTTCPNCAKYYGKNYTIGIAKV